MFENSVFRILRKTPPLGFPVTLKEVRSFLEIRNDKDDDLLLSLVSIAAEYAQWYIEQSLSKQTWLLSCAGDNIPKKICLPFGPVIAVTSVVTTGIYGDVGILEKEKYLLDISRSSIIFSSMLNVAKIDIVYDAGYTDAKDVPMQIKCGMLHHIAIAYKRRDAMKVGHLTFIKEIYSPFREVKLVL
ncbi:MAG: head-tail connector protein [Anaplasma sp.]